MDPCFVSIESKTTEDNPCKHIVLTFHVDSEKTTLEKPLAKLRMIYIEQDLVSKDDEVESIQTDQEEKDIVWLHHCIKILNEASKGRCSQSQISEIVSDFSYSALTSIMKSYLTGEGYLIFVPLLSQIQSNSSQTLQTLKLANSLQSLLPLSMIEPKKLTKAESFSKDTMDSRPESKSKRFQRLVPIKKQKKLPDTDHLKHLILKATLLMNNQKELALRLAYLRSQETKGLDGHQMSEPCSSSIEESNDTKGIKLQLKLIESQLIDLRAVLFFYEDC